MKHIKDQGTVGVFNVLGDGIDAAGRTLEEHEHWIEQLELNPQTPITFLKKHREWKQRTATFAEFVMSRCLDQDQFGKDLVGLKALAGIQSAVREMKRTGWLTIDTADYDKLRQATDKPHSALPYFTNVGTTLLSFAIAIVEQARDELPPEAVRAGPNGTEVVA